jgi:3-hydroxyisobutyrate dehydrogenase-like beta-hydroxyacid dehydrogenase
MTPQQIGILYPGEMGISLAASAQQNGHQVYWASEGRSVNTRTRAAKFRLYDTYTVEKLCAECSMLISVCPPHAAEAVAQHVLACAFAGLYLGATVGTASALKMCFAAYTKGTTALLCAILATAESLGVREALYQHWTRDDPGFGEQASQRVRRVTAKAWRFVGEMEEIASTFNTAGMPGDFHSAAADIYRRLAQFKDAPATPTLEDVLGALLQAEGDQAL